MSKFESWLCDEVRKTHELHEIFCDLARVDERLSKFKYDNNLRGLKREIGIVMNVIINYEVKLNCNLKSACSKHSERNEKRRSELR